MPGLAADVPNRVTDSHREACPPGSPVHETNTVALAQQLEGTRITRICNPHPKVTPSSLKMVAPERQQASRSTITPLKSEPFYLVLHQLTKTPFKP